MRPSFRKVKKKWRAIQIETEIRTKWKWGKAAGTTRQQVDVSAKCGGEEERREVFEGKGFQSILRNCPSSNWRGEGGELCRGTILCRQGGGTGWEE